MGKINSDKLTGLGKTNKEGLRQERVQSARQVSKKIVFVREEIRGGNEVDKRPPGQQRLSVTLTDY